MAGMPLFSVGGEFRPVFGERLKYGPALLAEYHRSLGLESQRLGQEPLFPTVYQAYTLGAAWFISVMEIRAAYHHSLFRLEASDDGAHEADLPNIEYDAIKTGVQLTIQAIEKVELILSGDFLFAIRFNDSFKHLKNLDTAILTPIAAKTIAKFS